MFLVPGLYYKCSKKIDHMSIGQVCVILKVNYSFNKNNITLKSLYDGSIFDVNKEIIPEGYLSPLENFDPKPIHTLPFFNTHADFYIAGLDVLCKVYTINENDEKIYLSEAVYSDIKTASSVLETNAIFSRLNIFPEPLSPSSSQKSIISYLLCRHARHTLVTAYHTDDIVDFAIYTETQKEQHSLHLNIKYLLNEHFKTVDELCRMLYTPRLESEDQL